MSKKKINKKTFEIIQFLTDFRLIFESKFEPELNGNYSLWIECNPAVNINLEDFGLLNDNMLKFIAVEEKRNNYYLTIENDNHELVCNNLRMSRKTFLQFLTELLDYIRMEYYNEQNQE